jgi:hypothetical protein
VNGLPIVAPSRTIPVLPLGQTSAPILRSRRRGQRNVLFCAPECYRSAPRLPHFTQHTLSRNRSLEASPPQRMIRGVIAMGVRCMQVTFLQSTHNHGADWRITSGLGGVTSDWRGMPPAWRAT